MAISEDKLESLSKLPSSTAFQEKRQSIETALSRYTSWPSEMKWLAPYLQGSYANNTHIRGESDVDIVIELTSAFVHNISSLSQGEQEQFHRDFSNASHNLAQFKEHVLEALRSYFGSTRIQVGNKSIKVLPPASGGIYADVIVCQCYREYESYKYPYAETYIDGIAFWSGQGEKIINFPKRHRTNGEKKNQDCGHYKSTVRVVKNLKCDMVDSGYLHEDTAPSYFVECLVFNLPNDQISSSRTQTLLNFLSWYINLEDKQKSGLVCGNWARYLFCNSGKQWNQSDADRFIVSLWHYYKNN